MWWDEHRHVLTQAASEWERVEPEPVRHTTSLPYLRLPRDLMEAIQQCALAHGISYQRLIQQWLEERLEVERQPVAPPARKAPGRARRA